MLSGETGVCAEDRLVGNKWIFGTHTRLTRKQQQVVAGAADEGGVDGAVEIGVSQVEGKCAVGKDDVREVYEKSVVAMLRRTRRTG